MATHDDDPLTGAVPDPETAATPAELAHARRFSELVDKTLAGRTPPAMSADDRALLEVATVIRATRGNVELAGDRQHAIIESALRQAVVGRSEPGALPSIAPRPRARWRSPWLVSGASTLAAAALAVLWLRAPVSAPATTVGAVGPRAAMPVEWRSRSADALIGPISRDRAGDASARIDAIFADRLDGFRTRLAHGGKR